MFGTFEPEGAKVVYGLVHPLASWNPVWAQMHSVVYMARHLWSMEGGLSARLSFLLKGPGWSPGKPRTGCPEDIPVVSCHLSMLYIYSVFVCVQVPEGKPYDPAVPAWLSAYCVVHFALVTYAIQLLMKHKLVSHTPTCALHVSPLPLPPAAAVCGGAAAHSSHAVLPDRLWSAAGETPGQSSSGGRPTNHSSPTRRLPYHWLHWSVPH